MEATAVAHPNIALVKYWGKRDQKLNLPAAGSLSVTLAGLSTTTQVQFDEHLTEDRVTLDGEPLETGRSRRRVVDFLDLVRHAAGFRYKAHVETKNDFPTAAGLASSASGFAALAVAAASAAGLDWSRRRLSVLARRGSGSAARSLFGGYVEMKPGTRSDGSDAHAIAIATEDHWDLRCLIALTARGKKETGSTRGMLHTQESSPLFESWRQTVPGDIEEARHCIDDRNFEGLGSIAERSCLRMHATAIGADPGILYWNAATVALIHRIRRARADGLNCFFTIDAGPHVKAFCLPEQATDLRSLLTSVDGVENIISARPGGGAHCTPGPTGQ